MNNKNVYWIWILQTVGGNSSKVIPLIDRFGGIEQLMEATDEEIYKIDFLRPAEKDEICKKDTSKAESLYRFCLSKGIEIISYLDERYPTEFKQIDNPPAVLFAYGNVEEAFAKPKICIVGTRDSTPYGEMTTAKLSGALAKSGFSIVAGVAKGIDTSAINAALKVGGSVIAILPGGHTKTHFTSSYKFKGIPAHGVILSENLPDAQVYKSSYHDRNRLLSGLSLGVVVTQAPKSSGALITARCSLDQGRDVFAVPANVDMPQSIGSNLLIRDGAVPVIDHTDVINYYIGSLGEQIKTDFVFDPSEVSESLQPDLNEQTDDFRRVAAKSLSDDQQIIFKYIGLTQTDINYIIEQSGLPITTVMSTLSELEAEGMIVACPGNKYMIKL